MNLIAVHAVMVKRHTRQKTCTVLQQYFVRIVGWKLGGESLKKLLGYGTDGMDWGQNVD